MKASNVVLRASTSISRKSNINNNSSLRHCHPKVAVALSGGVDSSVAAFLLKQQTQQDCFDLIGIHMFNWDTNDEDDEFSCSANQEQDWKDAQEVAQQLNIPIVPTSFVAEYWTQVFEPFCDELQQQQHQGSKHNMCMPNPDILCNRYIKFGALQQYCQETLGNDYYLATGHYARLWHRDSNSHHPLSFSSMMHHDTKDTIHDEIEQMIEGDPTLDWIPSWGKQNNSEDTPLLLAATDRTKDQSYFLSAGGISSNTGIPGDAFRNVLFPLGGMMKKKDDNLETLTVRELALSSNLPTANKRESMGICFVGKRKNGFGRFMDQYYQYQEQKQQQQFASNEPYQFVDIDTGEFVVGDDSNCSNSQDDHKNIARKYLTFGQKAKISGSYQKWFVVSKDLSQKIILVCGGTHHPALYSDSLKVKQIHWMTGIPPKPLLLEGQMRAKCRIRHLQPLMDCTIIKQEDDCYQVVFDKPVRAITPSQQVVFYVGQDGLICLGGGPILERGPTFHERNIEMNL